LRVVDFVRKNSQIDALFSQKINSMTTRQILEIEKNNLEHINLFYEGPYWRAYERSALLWVRSVGAGAARRKFYKNADCELAVVAIPASMLDRYLHRAALPVETVERGDGRIVLRSGEKLGEEAFLGWKSSLDIHSPRPKHPPSVEPDNAVFRMIREFGLEGATHAECLYFIRDLKLHLGVLEA
jgi:hypothetical protein